MNIQDLVVSSTNEKGRRFIKTYVTGPFKEVYFTEGNWFLATTENGFGYSLPYKDDSAGPSHFGDKAYTEKHLRTCKMKKSDAYRMIVFVHQRISEAQDKIRDIHKSMRGVEDRHELAALAKIESLEYSCIEELKVLLEWIEEEFPDAYEQHKADNYDGPGDQESGYSGTSPEEMNRIQRELK